MERPGRSARLSATQNQPRGGGGCKRMTQYRRQRRRIVRARPAFVGWHVRCSVTGMKKRIRNKIAKREALAPKEPTVEERADAEIVARIAEATKHALQQARSIEAKAEHM